VHQVGDQPRFILRCTVNQSSRFPVQAGFLHHKAPATSVMLTDTITETLCFSNSWQMSD